eukprot:m.332024 g.332024  ORF g.332024 m.332024 type:complete len:213 (+) comp16856_c0_seq1:100-738(+)
MGDNDYLCPQDELMAHNVFDPEVTGTNCPTYSVLFGALGAFSALTFTSLGAAYATAKSTEGICKTAILHPEFIMKSMIPIVMAGVGPIYGLVVSVLLVGGGFGKDYSLFKGFVALGAGLATGISGVASGYAVGISGDTLVRMSGQTPKAFVVMIQVQAFASVMGLWGLIVSLTMGKAESPDCHTPCYNPCCPNGACAVWENGGPICESDPQF